MDSGSVTRWGLGFRVQGSKFRGLRHTQGWGIKRKLLANHVDQISGFGFDASGFGFSVSGFRVWCFRFQIWCFGFRGRGLGFNVSGFGDACSGSTLGLGLGISRSEVRGKA